MIEKIVIFTEAIIVKFGSLGVFIASIIEEVIAPIPSAGVMLSAGAALLQDGFNPFFDLFVKISIPIALGIAVGSLFVFFLANRFGDRFIKKFGKFFGISIEDLEKVRKVLANGIGDEVALVLLRFVPFVPSVVLSAFFGLVKMPVWRYLILSFLGSLVRATALVYVGYKAGEFYDTYVDKVAYFEDLVFSIIFLSAAIFLVYRLWKNKKKRHVIININE